MLPRSKRGQHPAWRPACQLAEGPGCSVSKRPKITASLGSAEYFAHTGYLFLGDLYRNSRKREAALVNLKKAEWTFRELGMDYWLTKTREIMGRL
jgi:hypothetical protein